MAWVSGNRYLSQSEMENNAIIISGLLLSKGWSFNAISALLGNMQSESTINPGIWESLTVNYERGFGLTQWTPATKYINWAGADWESGDKQVERIIYESENEIQWFSNPEAPTVDPPITFKEFTSSLLDVETLANYFLWYYEHPAVTIQPIRGEQALKWYELIAGGLCPNPSPRLTDAGMQGNPYWYSLNPFYQSGFGLPNCTAYCWGRWYEIREEAPDTSLGNADTWFDYAVAHGQETGQTPRVGAIMVWAYKGGGDGGHVSVVEKIHDDGHVTTSNSAYGGAYFYTQELYPENGWEWGSHTIFQGFIYLDCNMSPIVPPTPPKSERKKMPLYMYLFP